MRSFFSGILGGAVLVTIIIIITMTSFEFHSYKIVNASRCDTTYNNVAKVKLLKELEKEGVLLTPQEYTSNIASYYNTLITILIFLFILFSFLSYFHLKFLAKEQLQEQVLKIFEDKIKDSKQMEKIIIEAFAGKADDKYASIESVEALNEKIENFLQDNYDEEESNDENVTVK